MGRNVVLKKAKVNILSESLMNAHKEIDSKDKLVEILSQFGEVDGDNYYILNNEFYEDYNSYYELSAFLDEFYGIVDSFECIMHGTDEAVCNMNCEEVEVEHE